MSPEIQHELKKSAEQAVTIDELIEQDAQLLMRMKDTLGRCDELLQAMDKSDATTEDWKQKITVLKVKFADFSERKTTVLPSKIEQALTIWQLREKQMRSEMNKSSELRKITPDAVRTVDKLQVIQPLEVEKLGNGGFKVKIPESDSITIHHDVNPATTNPTTQFTLDSHSSGYEHYFVGNIQRNGNTVTFYPHASYTGELSMTHNGRNINLRTLQPISEPKKTEPAKDVIREQVSVQQKIPGQYEIVVPKSGPITLHYDQFGKSRQHTLYTNFSAFRNENIADLERTSDTSYTLKVRPDYTGPLRLSFGSEQIDVRQFEAYALKNLQRKSEATDELLQKASQRSLEDVQRGSLGSATQYLADIRSAQQSIKAEKLLFSQALQNNSTLSTDEKGSITQRIELLNKQEASLDAQYEECTLIVDQLQKREALKVSQNQISSRFEGIVSVVNDSSNGVNMLDSLSDMRELSERIMVYERTSSIADSEIQTSQIAVFTAELTNIKEQLRTLQTKAESRVLDNVEQSYIVLDQDVAELLSRSEDALDYAQIQAQLIKLDSVQSRLTTITNETATIIQNSNGSVSDQVIADILVTQAKFTDLQPNLTAYKEKISQELTKQKEYILGLKEKYNQQTTDQLLEQYNNLKDIPKQQQEYEALLAVLKERRNKQFIDGSTVYVVLPKQHGLETDQQVIEQGTMYFDRSTNAWFIRNTTEGWSVALLDIDVDQKSGQRLLWLTEELEDTKNSTGKAWSAKVPEAVPESLQSKFIQRKFEYLETHTKMSYDEYQQLFGGEFQQQNVGNCYMIAALRALPKDHLQVMLRTSVQRLPNGSYTVSLPVGTQPPTTTITVLPSDLQAQNTIKNGVSISMRPVNGARGWQVLESAYTLHLLEKQQDVYRKDEDYCVKKIQEYSAPSAESKEKVDDYKKSLSDVRQKLIESTPRDSRGQLNRKASEGGWGELLLQTFIENDSNDRMSIYVHPNISTDSKAVQKATALLDNFHNGRDSMVTSTTAHKDGDSRTYSIDGKTFYHQHQYLVQSVDKQRQQVTVVNPHDTSKPFTLSYSQFMRAFNSMNMHSIDYNKLFTTKNTQ